MKPTLSSSATRQSGDQQVVVPAVAANHSGGDVLHDPSAVRLNQIADLRRRITALHRHGGPVGDGVSQNADLTTDRAEFAPTAGRQWGLGLGGLDLRKPASDWIIPALATDALATDALHEIKPSDLAGQGSAVALASAASLFALLLMARRLRLLDLEQSPALRHAPLVWCGTSAITSECGRPYGPGLARLGLDPSRLLLVEPRTRADTLWTIEESLKSESLAGIVAILDDADLTESRRLALAAATGRTPCLLVTGLKSSGLAGTATRWLVDLAASMPHRFDRTAPGHINLGVTLDRCRHVGPHGGPLPLGRRTILEWCDDAYHFRVAAGLADRSDAAGCHERRPEGLQRRPRALASVA